MERPCRVAQLRTRMPRQPHARHDPKCSFVLPEIQCGVLKSPLGTQTVSLWSRNDFPLQGVLLP